MFFNALASAATWSSPRTRPSSWVLSLCVGAIVSGFVSSASAATVSIAADTIAFVDDTTVDIPILLEGAMGVAGVDFIVEYDLADFANGAGSSHLSGNLLSLVSVNHDFVTDGINGTRQIKVAAASATGLTVTDGTLLTLSLSVSCAGYAQGFPGGRTVTVRVLNVNVFDELGAALAAGSNDGLLTLNCSSVGVEDVQSLSTIKYFYRN
jgi:hypothetical protein